MYCKSHSVGTTNVGTKFHGNKSHSYWDIEPLCLFLCGTSSLCPNEVMLGHRKAAWWSKYEKSPEKKLKAHVVWKFKPFQMVFKTRCSAAASGWRIRLHTRGKLKPRKSYISTNRPETYVWNAGVQKSKAKHAFCHYCLDGIMNPECGGQGQQRTGEACFIISLPTDVLSLLLLFQYVSCQWGLEVHHEESLEEERARRGWGVKERWGGTAREHWSLSISTGWDKANRICLNESFNLQPLVSLRCQYASCYQRLI